MKKLLLSSIAALTIAAPALAGQVTFIQPKTSGYCVLINVYDGSTTTPYWISLPYQIKQANTYAQGGASTLSTNPTGQIIAAIQANGTFDRLYYAALASKNSGGQISFTVNRTGVDAFCGVSTIIDDWYSN